MGAVRMRDQTADKNITIIHTTPVHINILWSEKLHVCKECVRKPLYHKAIFKLQTVFSNVSKFFINNIAFPAVKKLWNSPDSSKKKLHWDFAVGEQQGMDFFIGLKMDYRLIFW